MNRSLADLGIVLGRWLNGSKTGCRINASATLLIGAFNLMAGCIYAQDSIPVTDLSCVDSFIQADTCYFFKPGSGPMVDWDCIANLTLANPTQMTMQHKPFPWITNPTIYVLPKSSCSRIPVASYSALQSTQTNQAAAAQLLQDTITQFSTYQAKMDKQLASMQAEIDSLKSKQRGANTGPVPNRATAPKPSAAARPQ